MARSCHDGCSADKYDCMISFLVQTELEESPPHKTGWTNCGLVAGKYTSTGSVLYGTLNYIIYSFKYYI